MPRPTPSPSSTHASAAARRADTLVLGAGAAGLFLAGRLAQARPDWKVIVLDHAERAGKKILMSGGGRCNYTNTLTGPENFLSGNPRFCRSALAGYGPWEFHALVQAHGIGAHEKTPGQWFCDQSSRDIVRLLLAECGRGGADVRLGVGVAPEVTHTPDEGFRVPTSEGVWQARNLVVATGGLSVPTLGATGFGHDLARRFGHTVTPLRAGLVPFTLAGPAKDTWCDLSGLSLPIRASAGGQGFAEPMLITHRGLSGPAVLQVSSYWSPGEPLTLDLLPGLDAADWLAGARRRRPQAGLASALADAAHGPGWPRRLAQRFEAVFAHPDIPLGQWTREETAGVAQALADWPVTPAGTEGWRTAEVTLGGVDTNTVSSRTLESRRLPGLYFVGEVLDVTGWLGGHNFQWAWASAAAAARALAG